VFATEEPAKAAIALAQLSQLRDIYRDLWVPNWEDLHERKHCIYFFRQELHLEDFLISKQKHI